MTLKEQFNKLKENWLIAIVLLGLVFAASIVPNLTGSRGGYYGGITESAMFASKSVSSGMVLDESGFAPGVSERKLTKSAWLSSEIERGEFSAAEEQLKAVIEANGAYLLKENVNKYGQDITYYSGTYQIKVETVKYSLLIPQLKELGEVQSFSENTEDITAQALDLKTELEAESKKLAQYQLMLKEATTVTEKMEIIDRIYSLEKTINYLENALKNIDQKVDYSTVYLTLSEEQSKYANVALMGLSQLVQNLVESFNSLLQLVFWILPYAIVGGLIWVGIRIVKRRK